jgi:hypothetical protein
MSGLREQVLGSVGCASVQEQLRVLEQNLCELERIVKPPERIFGEAQPPLPGRILASPCREQPREPVRVRAQ